VLSGNGTAKIDGTTLEVTVPAKLGYVWIKLK
jgi:hypothetical protein